MATMRYSRYIITKSYLSISLLFLSIGVFWLRQIPAEWHKSIYNHIPQSLLILLLTATIISIISILTFDTHHDIPLSIALISPFASALVLFYSAPALLGYSGQIGDLVVHLSAVNKIIEQGIVPDSPYPALYVDAGVISLISSKGANAGLTVLGVISYMSFVLVSVSHARRIDSPIAAVPLFVPIVASINPLPALMSYMALFVTACFVIVCVVNGNQRNRHRYWALSLPMVLILPLAHPLVAINLIMYSGIAVVFLLFYHLFKSDQDSRLKSGSYLGVLSGVSIASFWLWVNHGRPHLLERAGTIISATLIGIQRSEVASKADISNTLLGQYGYSIFDVIQLGISQYGDILGVILISGTAITLSLILKHRTATPNISVFHVVVVILPPVVAFIDFFTNIFSGIQFLRFLRPSLYISPVICASILLFSQSANDKSRAQTLAVLILSFCIITTPVLIAGANHYSNPSSGVSVNSYRSDAELAGYSWFFHEKSRDIGTQVLWWPTTRVAGDLLGGQEQKRRSGMIGATASSRIPDHLGNGTLGNNTKFYYVQGTRERKVLLGPLRASNRLSRKDINQIKWDPTVSQLYANGNVNVSLVYPRS